MLSFWIDELFTIHYIIIVIFIIFNLININLLLKDTYFCIIDSLIMEENNTYRVLGVMSGTSLDGVDLALIEFKTRERRFGAILK